MARHFKESPDASQYKESQNRDIPDLPSTGAVGMISSVEAGQKRTHRASGQGEYQGNSERSRKRGGGLLSTLFIVIGVVLLLVAGGMWGLAQYRYWKQNQINEKLATHVTVRDVEPDSDEPPIDVDWAALKAVNDDIVGWIYVPGTVVNYPVYQGETNEDYLRTNAEGEWSVGGQIFLDCENTAPGMVDNQSFLYGHHLQDGTMFQPLFLLDDQEVFDKTETIWYLTENECFELEPLMLYWVEPYDETVRKFKFNSEAEFRSYLKGKLDGAVTRRADAEELVSSARRVLCMSTCNYYDGYGRSILVAIEKPKAEATSTTTSS